MSYSILVVDDSRIVRRAVRRCVAMSGLQTDQVIEAADGVEALEVLRTVSIDLVLADLHMPHMSGVELVERMAASPEWAEIPVVIITSDRSTKQVERLRRLGVVAYLEKPMRPERLRAVVEGIAGKGVRRVA